MRGCWLPVLGYETKYKISSNGDIYSLITNKILRPATHPKGYKLVVLGSRKDGSRRTEKVHQLVLKTFIGPRPKGFECAHMDGNPGNNSIDNLKWVTAKENTKHKWIHGTMTSKLSEWKVLSIRKLLKQGFLQKELAEYFNVSHYLINLISNKKVWYHI